MAFLLDFFRPTLASRNGQMLASASRSIGTGGVAASASGTVAILLPLPRVKLAVQSLNVVASVAAAGSAAITVQVFKVTGAGVATALTATKSIKSDIVTAAGTFAIAITGSDQTRFIDGSAGDYVRVDIVAAGTVTTQPTAAVVAEFGFSA